MSDADEIKTLHALNDAQAAEIARLSAELEKCREDAERYRWLRDHSGDDIAVVTNCGVTDVGSTGVSGTYEELLDGAELDRTVDAARRSP